MRKTLAAVGGVLALALAGTAVASPLVAITDPTPDGSFTGTYVISNDDPNTAENEYSEGTQQGYVGVYDDGVVVCNGNPEITRPDDGSPLQGYIWVGSGQAATNPTASDPSGNVGAGNNHEDAAGNPTGASPCPDADPAGANE